MTNIEKLTEYLNSKPDPKSFALALLSIDKPKKGEKEDDHD